MPYFSVVSDLGKSERISDKFQILIIRRIIEGVRAKDLKITLWFVDFSLTFDFIHRGNMEQILVAYTLPKETVTAKSITQIRKK